MSKMIVKHRTDDFNKWKTMFDSMEPVRRKYGSTGSSVFRGHADPNEIVIFTHWGNQDQAKKYGQSDELKEAMNKGGVTGSTEFYFVE